MTLQFESILKKDWYDENYVLRILKERNDATNEREQRMSESKDEKMTETTKEKEILKMTTWMLGYLEKRVTPRSVTSVL